MQRFSPQTDGVRSSAVFRPAALFLAALTLSAGLVSAQVQPPPGVPQAFLAAGAAVPTELNGDGDPFIENNETWQLTVPLTNNGGVNATDISAVLTTSTPGVTIVSGNSTYSNLAPAASGNNLKPYIFDVGAATPCGSVINFTLTVTYTGGPSPQVFNFSITTGSPGTPVTFSYTGPPVPIPDGADLSGTLPGAPVSAPLAIAGVVGNIYDVNFSIDGTTCDANTGSTTVGIDHSFVNDLELTLISPTATSVLVINNTGGGGNNFCQTALDDESAGPNIQTVVAAQAPFTGNFTPKAALSGFDGQTANGAWQLQAQDFFSQDTGNIRAFSVTVTPAVCNAPLPGVLVQGIKRASGIFAQGGSITYTVTLHNDGFVAQADNAGNEFTDVLPSSLTLLGAFASSGAAVVTVGTNTVTWNGAIPADGYVTIDISATVNAACGVISNQGNISYDADGNGSNEATGVTNDPVTPLSNDPTSFTIPSTAHVTATKVANGVARVGQSFSYTIVLTNSGCLAQADNAGDEFTDVLPPTLTLVSATASSGTATATVGTNTVTWNGALPANGGTVTITINTTVVGPAGLTVTNQGACLYDANGDGTNDNSCVTDNPATGTANDPTTVTAQGALVVEVPTLSEVGLALLCLALSGAALLFLRRRRTA